VQRIAAHSSLPRRLAQEARLSASALLQDTALAEERAEREQVAATAQKEKLPKPRHGTKIEKTKSKSNLFNISKVKYKIFNRRNE
jgi:hypothetical protein